MNFLQALSNADQITINGDGWYDIQSVSESCLYCSGEVFDLYVLKRFAKQGKIELQALQPVVWDKTHTVDSKHDITLATHRSTFTDVLYKSTGKGELCKVFYQSTGWEYSTHVYTEDLNNATHYIKLK